MSNTRIGLILYTLRDFMKTKEDFARTLARVKETGYDAVELAGIGPLTVAEVAKRARDNDLAIVSGHVGWEGLANNMQEVVDQHKELGCDHVVVSSMPGEFRSGEGYQRFAKMMSEAGAKLAEQGMTVGYHNHSFEFTQYDGQSGQELLRVHSDPDHFNFEIDTYWIQHGGGDPAKWIMNAKGRVPTVHMKDMIMHEGDQMFAPVGEGNLNWPAILEACKKAGVKYHIVEQDRCLRDPFDCIASSLKNMKAWGLS